MTHIFLETYEADLRAQGPALFAGVPFHHNLMPVPQSLTIQQLWILVADDPDTPSGETSQCLKRLTADARPISLAVFPRTEHGIFEYELSANGERLSTRQPEAYFQMMTDFIQRGRIEGRYAPAVITKRTGR